MYLHEGYYDAELLVLPPGASCQVLAVGRACENAAALVLVRLRGRRTPEELGEGDGAMAGGDVGPEDARTSGDGSCCHSVGVLEDVNPAISRSVEDAEENFSSAEVSDGVGGRVADDAGELLEGEERIAVEVDLWTCQVDKEGRRDDDDDDEEEEDGDEQTEEEGEEEEEEEEEDKVNEEDEQEEQRGSMMMTTEGGEERR